MIFLGTELVSFDEVKTYNLVKFRKTNQGTCINLKQLLKKEIKFARDKFYVKDTTEQGN